MPKTKRYRVKSTQAVVRESVEPVKGKVILGDNLPVLKQMTSESVDLIYIDPPFNTGKVQRLTRIKATPDPKGDRVGFAGRTYKTVPLGTQYFADVFDDYLSFLAPRLQEAYRLLKPTGSLYLHIDYREVHYCKILLDLIFGRECFLNEVIWAFDFGGRSFRKWPCKHQNILFYAKDPRRYTFNAEAVERLPYLAPGLVGPEKAARGKFPTDVWWHTIVPTNGDERTGYPTQKPLPILKRIIAASSHPGDLVLDFFAGSGTTGEACLSMARRFVLVDNNPEALKVMARRFSRFPEIEWVNFDPTPYQISQVNLQMF